LSGNLALNRFEIAFQKWLLPNGFMQVSSHFSPSCVPTTLQGFPGSLAIYAITKDGEGFRPLLLRIRDCRSDSHENDGGVRRRDSQRGPHAARVHVHKRDRECARDRALCNYGPMCKHSD